MKHTPVPGGRDRERPSSHLEISAVKSTRLSSPLAILSAHHKTDLALAAYLTNVLGKSVNRVTVWRWREGRCEPRWSVGERICGLVAGIEGL
jgi:hypothetical protein